MAPLQFQETSAAGGDRLETTAVVYLCEWKSEGWLGLSFDPVSDQVGHYVVRYSYSVDGELFDGKFTAGAPFEEGHKFAISFDPKKPWKNTGGDTASGMSLTQRVFSWLLAGSIVLLLLWVRARWFN